LHNYHVKLIGIGVLCIVLFSALARGQAPAMATHEEAMEARFSTGDFCIRLILCWGRSASHLKS
jgi:hypothetical protein